MTTATAQINIPFELLADAIENLGIEHKIRLWQLLGQEIAESQKIPASKASIGVTESLDRTVENILIETGMTEDELVETFLSISVAA